MNRTQMKQRTSRLVTKTPLRRAPGPDRQVGPPSRDARRRAPRKPIPKVSAKHAVDLADYHAQAPEFFAANPWCKPCQDGALVPGVTPGVVNPAGERHHMRGRIGRKDLLDQRYHLPVCRAHHRYITDEHQWALDHGYSLPRNTIREDAA